MLAKCANPSCSAPFLHLTDGKLFRLETDAPFHTSRDREPEYFWLCEPCSARTTLSLARDGTVGTTGLADVRRMRPPVARKSLDRGHGLLLRSVSFLPDPPQEAHENPSRARTVTAIRRRTA